jgi:hypothetical protein
MIFSCLPESHFSFIVVIASLLESSPGLNVIVNGTSRRLEDSLLLTTDNRQLSKWYKSMIQCGIIRSWLFELFVLS